MSKKSKVEFGGAAVRNFEELVREARSVEEKKNTLLVLEEEMKLIVKNLRELRKLGHYNEAELDELVKRHQMLRIIKGEIEKELEGRE